MWFTQRVQATCAILYLLGQTLFLVGIQYPRTHNFDEYHYVPAAKQFLELKENRNFEHPPLAKEIMAAGIALFGDRPVGWRFMSTVFGALTLVGMYLWALALFRNQETALWVALLTLCNHLLFVQARIGMLDTFLFCFMTFALAAFTAAWDPYLGKRETRWLLVACGICLGLATACKWFGVVAWAYCAAGAAWAKFASLCRKLRGQETESGPQHPELWAEIGAWEFVVYLGIIPLGFYLLTFVPFFFLHDMKHPLSDLFFMQKRMWEGQGRVIGEHPYKSFWYQWPLLHRPIWYAFDKEGAQQEFVRGVLLLGNPLVMWGGIVALFACFWDGLILRKREGLFVLSAYLAFFLSWLVIPRKVAFYYYYYPAGMTLSLAFGCLMGKSAFRWIFLAAAAGVFIYFFPILSAMKIPTEEFRRWMWFRSWI